MTTEMCLCSSAYPYSKTMAKFSKKSRRKGEWKFRRDRSGKWYWRRHINGRWVNSSNTFDRKGDCISAARKLGYRG